MLNVTNPHAQVIAVLSNFRQEWEDAAQGQSLLEVEGNIGMVLSDLVNSFGLTTHERVIVLGPELVEDVQDLLSQPSPN